MKKAPEDRFTSTETQPASRVMNRHWENVIYCTGTRNRIRDFTFCNCDLDEV